MANVKAALTLVSIAVCFQHVAGQTVVTNTTYGQVMGVKTPIPGSMDLVITRYMGIPYAEPPTGQRRFAKPVPKAPWAGVLSATLPGPICPQPPSNLPVVIPDQNMEMDEDCLVLNVYVPHDAVAARGSLPVMVYIHGGALINGNGGIYDGTFLAVQGQVIVVNINYRLGLFGFLSTGDDSSPGNYGLWDQRLAIQWVKDNIRSFGGDPDQITIFGESAGGWSVTYQMASPLNDRTLFQRVISQSGVGFPGLVIPGDLAKLQAWGLGSALGCNLTYVSSSRDLIRCLRGQSMEDLVSHVSFETTAPTIDGEFLTESIDSLLSHPRVGQYDLLLGVNSQEGTVFASGEDSYTPLELRTTIQTYISITCQCDNPDDITDAIFAFYFGADDLEDTRANVLRYFDVIGDLYFDIPAANLLRRHAKAAESTNTYSYYFTEETGNEYFASAWVPGAPHALDIIYVFGLVKVFLQTDTSAVMLSNSIIQYWTQFAWNGNPNGAGLPEWPEFEAENETYIILDANIRTGEHLKIDKIAFWNDYIPEITERSGGDSCSYEVPIRSGTVRKPGTKTVEISSKDGGVLGSVMGATSVADEAVGGRDITRFLGIPYAQPPLGDLRFRPPQDTGPWGDEPLGIPDTLPPACPQDVTKDPWMVRLGFNQTSEDCLTLNIFSPSAHTNDTSLPVLVFVHPGYGSHGTSSIYDGVTLASGIKAVVVVMNYRLGALGYATTEDDVAPGNYGLHDILAALKWVNNYIGSFGGDPDRVTLLGHGGGSALVHYLVLSEKAKGLFQRAVCMSASAITPTADNPVQPRASQKTKVLAKALDCPTEDGESMFECLREKPVAGFVENTKNPPFALAFPIVVDGDLLTQKPRELLKAGQINDIDLLIGIAQDEDAAVAFVLLGIDCPSPDKVEQLIQLVSSRSFNNAGLVSRALAAEYLTKGGLGDDCQPRGGFRQFLNDYISTWTTVEAARLHADAGKSVYFYSVDHEPQAHYAGPLPPQAGPALTDELQFLFGDPYGSLVDDLQLTYRLPDKQFTLELMTFLKNFVYNGEPGSSLSGVEWPAFDSDNLKYMSLTDCPKVLSGHENDWEHLHQFWEEFLTPLITAETAPPATGAPPACPTDRDPCTVGENIGLTLSPEEASSLIEALIGSTIGALVLAVFFFGGCMAYRVRAAQSEGTQGKQRAGGGLPNYLDVAEKEGNDTRL